MFFRQSYLLLILVIGCKTTKHSGENKFVTYYQQSDVGIELKTHLMHRVHAKQLYVHYGFAPSCSEQQIQTLSPEVEKAIARSFDLWLSGLRMAKKVTDEVSKKLAKEKGIAKWSFIPHVVSDYKIARRSKMKESAMMGSEKLYSTDSAPNVQKLTEMINKGKTEKAINILTKRSAEHPDVTITFYCQHGRSRIFTALRDIHIFEETSHRINIPNTKFTLQVLIHEIGHAFGLKDTYVDSQNPRRAHLVSTGVSPATIGEQIVSIMGPYYLLKFSNYEEIAPTYDDYLGFGRMYYYTRGIQKKIDKCPTEYKTETYTKETETKWFKKSKKLKSFGCVPQYPLITAFKRGNFHVAATIIHDFNHRLDIDINAQDNSGNTALHYAVARSEGTTDFIEDLLSIYHKTISLKIKNKAGYTARDVANRMDYGNIVTIIDQGPKKKSTNKSLNKRLGVHTHK